MVDPVNPGLLLKFINTKTKGEARSKLLERDITDTWVQVKTLLDENYATWRMIRFLYV
jgi:hypothetical protein